MAKFWKGKQADAGELEVTIEGERVTLQVALADSEQYIAAMELGRAHFRRLAKKRGSANQLSYSDQRDVVKARAARCIVGWSVDAPFTPQDAEALIDAYPFIVDKVVAFSDDEANFTQNSATVS